MGTLLRVLKEQLLCAGEPLFVIRDIRALVARNMRRDNSSRTGCEVGDVC